MFDRYEGGEQAVLVHVNFSDENAREDIEELVPSTVSIMPKGLEQALGEQDLADLIAYLKTLKKAP